MPGTKDSINNERVGGGGRMRARHFACEAPAGRWIIHAREQKKKSIKWAPFTCECVYANSPPTCSLVFHARKKRRFIAAWMTLVCGEVLFANAEINYQDWKFSAMLFVWKSCSRFLTHSSARAAPLTTRCFLFPRIQVHAPFTPFCFCRAALAWGSARLLIEFLPHNSTNVPVAGLASLVFFGFSQNEHVRRHSTCMPNGKNLNDALICL